MPVASLTGSDTTVINGRVLLDFADADNVLLTFPNDIATVKTGKNGNSIYALNSSGYQADVVLRIIRGSRDDKFLNELLALQTQDFAATTLLTGTFVKRVGDGAGGITSDTYEMSGGMFTKQVEGKSNVEGDTDQSLSIYTMKFTNAPRSLF